MSEPTIYISAEEIPNQHHQNNAPAKSLEKAIGQ